MKAIVNTAPGKLEWLDLPTPQPLRGQVRVRTAACGICATDLAMIAGWDRTKCPSVPGHEWSGVIDAVGAEVDSALVGCPCVAENVLSDGGEVGFEHPGGYGQFLLTEGRNVRKLPESIPLDHAALIEPLAVCVRALKRLDPRPNKSALVQGDGVIGQMMLVLLKRAGLGPITVVGGRPGRLALARELGASFIVNYLDAGGTLAVSLQKSPHGPFACVVEASGSSEAMAVAMEVAAREAKVLVIGDYGQGRANFPWNRVLHRELELIGSNASGGAWDEAVALAAGGEIPLARLVTRVLPAGSFAQAFDLARGTDSLKIVLDWRSAGA